MKDLEKYAIDYMNKFPTIDGAGFAWLDGAKSEAAKQYWQQGMYTEKETELLCMKAIIDTLSSVSKAMKGSISDLIDQIIWFEQNKKK